MTDREKQIFIQGMTMASTVPLLSVDAQVMLRKVRNATAVALRLGSGWQDNTALCEEIGRELDQGRKLAQEQ